MSQTPLTERERRFVAAYVGPAAANASAAAITAGYKPTAENAKKLGMRLLKRPHVAAAIAVAQERLAQKHAVTQDRVIQELARLAFSDIRQVFGPDGRLLPITQIDDDAAAAIQSWEQTDYGPRVRLAEKNAALVSLCRTLGLFKDRINVSFDIADLFRPRPEVIDVGARVE